MTAAGGVPNAFMGSGVKQDIHLLFNKFSILNSTKIRDFAEVFRELHFETIFHYRTAPTEFTEFAEYLLQNAALYCCKENEVHGERSFTERVFGIYLCYSLYNLQPSDHVCQISVTALQFKEILEFQRLLVAAKELESLAALKQLFLKKAFRFTMFQSTYDPATHRRYLAEEEMPDFGRQPIEPFAGVKAVQASRTLGEMMCIHNEYIEAKKKMGLTDIQLVDKVNPVDEINKQFEKHQNAANGKNTDTAQSSSRALPPESAGTSRAYLRSRAYTAKMKLSRHRRHLDPNMEENFGHLTFGDIARECLAESEAGPSAPPKTKSAKRKRVIKEEPRPMNDDEIAAEVLREEYASRVKPELSEEREEAAVGGKISKQGTSGVARIRAPQKRKGVNLMVVKSEKRSIHDPAPTAEQIVESFNNTESPDKKKNKRKSTNSTAKPRITDEWSTRLNKWSGQLQSTDKALKKLTSSIKIEQVDEET